MTAGESKAAICHGHSPAAIYRPGRHQPHNEPPFNCRFDRHLIGMTGGVGWRFKPASPASLTRNSNNNNTNNNDTISRCTWSVVEQHDHSFLENFLRWFNKTRWHDRSGKAERFDNWWWRTCWFWTGPVSIDSKTVSPSSPLPFLPFLLLRHPSIALIWIDNERLGRRCDSGSADKRSIAFGKTLVYDSIRSSYVDLVPCVNTVQLIMSTFHFAPAPSWPPAIVT